MYNFKNILKVIKYYFQLKFKLNYKLEITH
jgi:hypothetical protein